MILLKTPEQIAKISDAGSFVYELLYAAKDLAKPGVNLLEIDELVKKAIVNKTKAESCYVDYKPSWSKVPFGHYICTCVNDAVLHGVPFDYTLQTGDLLSLDLALSLDGWVADSAISFVVGNTISQNPQGKNAEKLIKATQVALSKGIEQARIGNRLGDVSFAIGESFRKSGFSKINLDFGGHEVGRTMHGELTFSNDGVPGTGPILKKGLVIAIEPWILETTDELLLGEDEWTIYSADDSWGAHSEHTVAITDEGPQILTLP